MHELERESFRKQEFVLVNPVTSSLNCRRDPLGSAIYPSNLTKGEVYVGQKEGGQLFQNKEFRRGSEVI